MAKIDDTLLVRRLQEGDVKAFDALYFRHHAALYRNVLKITKDAAAAQDIVQDVFTELWQRRGSMAAVQSVSGWLFVLSYNRSVSFLRARLKVNTALAMMGAEQPAEFDIRELQYELLMKAVGSLSPQKRAVFTLCKLEGKTYEEAAEAMHISRHTVKEYLGLAVGNVRDYIEKHPEEWGTAMLGLLVTAWLH